MCLHCISASCVTDSSECCVEMIYRSICLWSLCVSALHLSVMFHWQQWVLCRDDLQEYMSLITVCVCTASQCHVSLISRLIHIYSFSSSYCFCRLDVVVIWLFALSSLSWPDAWTHIWFKPLCLMKTFLTSEDNVFLLYIDCCNCLWNMCVCLLVHLFMYLFYMYLICNTIK